MTILPMNFYTSLVEESLKNSDTDFFLFNPHKYIFNSGKHLFLSCKMYNINKIYIF